MNRNPESYRKKEHPSENVLGEIESSFKNRRYDKALQNYNEQDAPRRSWQEVTKHQLNPKIGGLVMGLMVAAPLALDIINNGPSNFVLNYPAIAAAGIVGEGIFTGLVTAGVINEANAKEVAKARQTEREMRRWR